MRLSWVRGLFCFIPLYCSLPELHAQTRDCFPDCTVKFSDVKNERIPLFTSVAAIGNDCGSNVINAKIAAFEKEDADQYVLLRNQYCSALSGWIEIAPCMHGGPPPCCTAPPDVLPWRQVGPERATDSLLREWHKVRDARHDEIAQALQACLVGLASDAVVQFNGIMNLAKDCLQRLNNDSAYSATHSTTIDRYATLLNDFTIRIKLYTTAANPDPNNAAITVNYLNATASEICNTVKQLPAGGTQTGSIGRDSSSGSITPNSAPNVSNSSGMSDFNRGTLPGTQTKSQNPGPGGSPRKLSNAQSVTLTQQTQSYINAASDKDADGTQQAMNLAKAKLNLTYLKGQGVSNAAVNQQQQQVRQLETTQKLQNIEAIQNAGIAIIGIISDRATAKTQKEDQERSALEEEQQATREREAQQRQQVQQNDEINAAIAGRYSTAVLQKPSSIHERIYSVYYVFWARKDFDNTLIIFKPVLITKYKDDTWPTYINLENKVKGKIIGFSDVFKLSCYGYFKTLDATAEVCQNIKFNAKESGLYVSELTIDPSGPAVNNAKPGNSFWDN